MKANSLMSLLAAILILTSANVAEAREQKGHVVAYKCGTFADEVPVETYDALTDVVAGQRRPLGCQTNKFFRNYMEQNNCASFCEVEPGQDCVLTVLSIYGYPDCR